MQKRNNTQTSAANIASWFFMFGLVLLHVQSQSQSTERQYLSGTGNDHTINWQFFCTAGMNANKWTTIPVPSCWELQGFGKYDYGFSKDSTRGKEKGLYKYNFNVPATWKNKQINIVFEGSMTDTEVKINGQSAGDTHQGAFYCFRYNITKLLHTGSDNLLEVTVSKHSADPSVNAAERKADFWLFGGIFRPVYLEALPPQHIETIAIDAKANGQLTAAITTVGMADKISVQLYKANGSKTGEAIGVPVKEGAAIINYKYPSPQLWSPESPVLYKAVFNLYKNGKIVHTRSEKLGFRTITVKQHDGIYVNGVKVKMKGVNRHSFWPTSGRTTSSKISIGDVLLMKDMNMNAVRMSHYPPDDHFLDACDSLGLFVMDELAGWHGQYTTTTGTKLLKEMIAHDLNHPSIIFWSNGNEGGHNTELDPLFTQLDIQHRPVIHPWQLFGGFETQHYRDYNYGIGNYDHGHDIVMPTEFLHGLYDGGNGAGLEDYWEAMWRNPLSAGGFLWDFADEGVLRRDKNDSIDTDGNHGADGIVGPFHEKEGSYYAIKEIWSPVRLEPKEIDTDFDGKLNIENRFFYTNISQCSFSWKLLRFSPANGVVTDSLSGSAQSPSIAPGNKGVLQLALPKQWAGYHALYVTAKDPSGHELFTWSFPFASPAGILQTILQDHKGTKPQLSENDSLYTISVKGIGFSINKNSGLLKEVQQNGKTIPFHNGPVIQEGETNFKNFRSRYNNDTLIIQSSFDKKNSYNTLQWIIYPNGILKMQVNYFPGVYFTDFAGVNFSFPEKEIKGVQYIGNGPYRVWKNRMKGTRFGIWDKSYNNTETGEQWVYPEFKGYYSGMYGCKFIMQDASFRVLTDQRDIYLRLFTPAFKDDPWHNYQLVFPSGDISFMQAIPGIGTKTQRAETTGPMGMKNSFYDYEKDPQRAKTLILFFDFRGN